MNTRIEIEDLPQDIIAKAQLGLGLSDAQVLEASGLNQTTFEALKAGAQDEEALAAIAPVLQLNPRCLLALSRNEWYPEIPSKPCLHQFSSSYRGMWVNAYLIWDSFASKAVLFDTGTDASVILDYLEVENLELDAIMLTHTHPDHILSLDTLRHETHATVFSPANELLDRTQPSEEGQKFRFGKIIIYPIATPGHSMGGTSYKIEGLGSPILICGDSLFAGSVGGIRRREYTTSLKLIREKILTLPDSTLLCPGHGPMTTVANEKKHNPFFAPQ